MRALFVVRDITPARISLPLINMLTKQSDRAMIMAEGLATQFFHDNGLQPVLVGDNKMTPVSKEMMNLVNNFNPDIVCVGCSSPINCELQMAKWAEKLGIPIVAIEDIWGPCLV